MGKISKANAKQMLENKYIDQATYDKMISDGFATGKGRRVAGKVRVLVGTQIQPTLYFKNRAGADETDEMKAIKDAFAKLIADYTEEVEHKPAEKKETVIEDVPADFKPADEDDLEIEEEEVI